MAIDPNGEMTTQYEEGLEIIDRRFNVYLGSITYGISPAALAYAFGDWWQHLSLSPGKRMELLIKAFQKHNRLLKYQIRTFIEPECEECIEPLPHDTRFSGPDWKHWPYNHIYQSFLLTQQWWHNATTDVRGVSTHHAQVVNFATRQFLDLLSPSNFLLTNPEVLYTTLLTGGMNLLYGLQNFIEDKNRERLGELPLGAEMYRPGKEVAITPGKVIYRNRLIELIQYKPTTSEVYAEPILIVPAWIMKYYILDLSPDNSLVKYLVSKGHTVFIISWKNPTAEDAELGMEDYLQMGVMEALKAVCTITQSKAIHGVGYCIGGVLLAVAAAAMARDNDQRFKSVTLFTTQTDYTEAGELGLFIDESQITFLEDIMWQQGYLDAKQVSGAFQLLNSKDLIFSRSTQNYLLGSRQTMNDLMAWNADSTRLPYRMHSQYLRQLYLNNALAEGHYEVNNRPVTLHDIRTPLYVVATIKDHVSPWRSVYKIHLLTETEITFVLTSGGHNAGIINEPGHPRRSFQVATHSLTSKYLAPDKWQNVTPSIPGSWWPHWADWLRQHSTQQVSPPPIGHVKAGYKPLGDAPGTYVLE